MARDQPLPEFLKTFGRNYKPGEHAAGLCWSCRKVGVTDLIPDNRLAVGVSVSCLACIPRATAAVLTAAGSKHKDVGFCWECNKLAVLYLIPNRSIQCGVSHLCRACTPPAARALIDQGVKDGRSVAQCPTCKGMTLLSPTSAPDLSASCDSCDPAAAAERRAVHELLVEVEKDLAPSDVEGSPRQR